MKKILVVEDSSLVRLRIVNVLEENGFTQVEGFPSADPLLKNINHFLKNVDLIIMDIRLPGVSGIEFAETLHYNPIYTNIPIIFITGIKAVTTVTAAIKAGGIDYLVKPFKDDVLIERVINILGNPLETALNDVHISRENIEKIIRMEYLRALRGKHPLSFMVLDVEPKNLEQIPLEMKDILREIDIIHILEDQIFVILPITSEEGLTVVEDKIKNKIHIINFHRTSFHPENEKTLENLLNELFLKKSS